jgi:hypothetical protein
MSLIALSGVKFGSSQKGTMNTCFSSIVKDILKQAATVATPATPLQIPALFWLKSCSHSQLRAINEFKKPPKM